MNTVSIDELNIRYKDTGEGDVIVILQGWGTRLEVYDSIANTLVSGYRVIQFDFPGFGESTEPPEPWDPRDYAAFFIKFMKKLGIKKATLMGHSYGGRVIICLASGDKSKLGFEIEKLVLFDAAGILPQRTAAQEKKVKRYKRLKAFLSLPPVYALFKEPIEQWKSKQGSEDYRNATPIMRSTLVKAVNTDLSDKLPDIDYETLLIWGENDTATPLSDGQKMDKLIPNSGLAVIQNAGHYAFLEQPVVFTNILKSYFGL
ncbi:MAG: alpha/beta hydrolase [Lachnospiraceae bacterium]|nr:alpha/beta hydrolase [Lachnospiraceae bacterium]